MLAIQSIPKIDLQGFHFHVSHIPPASWNEWNAQYVNLENRNLVNVFLELTVQCSRKKKEFSMISILTILFLRAKRTPQRPAKSLLHHLPQVGWAKRPRDLPGRTSPSPSPRAATASPPSARSASTLEGTRYGNLENWWNWVIFGCDISLHINKVVVRSNFWAVCSFWVSVPLSHILKTLICMGIKPSILIERAYKTPQQVSWPLLEVYKASPLL